MNFAMTSSPYGPNGQTTHERLPSNRRRTRVAVSQRQRVICACNQCNVRRIKCSGERPCKACARNSRECIYPDVKERIQVSKDELESLRRECAVLRHSLEEATPSEAQRKLLFDKWNKVVSQDSDENNSVYDSAKLPEQFTVSAGRVLRYSNEYARFYGGSSGGVFIDQMRELVGIVLPKLEATEDFSEATQDSFFASRSSVGRIHTYDSRPIEMKEIDFMELPKLDEIAGFLGTFWDYVEDRNDPYSCGGIYYWGDFRKIISDAISSSEEVRKPSLSVLNGVLALACQFDSFPAQEGEGNPGETFFIRANHLIGNPLAGSTPIEMHALLMLGYYFVGCGRRDTAYIYIGAAMRIALLHGLHEGWVTDERQKRCFWSVFIIDRWLSCLTGRPPSISNESIILELPCDLKDQEMGNLPSCEGLRAHAMLAFIMGDISSNIYESIARKRDIPTTVGYIEICLRQLADWLDSLPANLRLTVSPSVESTNKIILHLKYNQLVLLCTRPLLMLAVRKRLMHCFVTQETDQALDFPESLLSTCIDAARRNAQLIIGLMESRTAAMMLTLRYHYAFNAAVVLELALLLHEYGVKNDMKLIECLIRDLWNPGRNVDECSLDCAKIVAEFYAVVQRARRYTSKANFQQMNTVVTPSQESNNDEEDTISYSRVLSAVELSTSYLPEIDEDRENERATSQWCAKR